MRSRLACYFSILLSALALAPAGDFLFPAPRTLAEFGGWEVTKAQLERPVMGGRRFAVEPQGTANGRLHLDAWHGYQEVVYTAAKPIRELRLRARLGEHAWLRVSLEHQGAVERKYYSPAQPAQEGVTFLAPEQWHELTFFENDLPPAGASRLSLRGGVHSCEIDDVQILFADGSRLHEKFQRSGISWLGRAVAGLAGALIASLVLLCVFAARISPVAAATQVVAIALCVSAVTLPLAGFRAYMAARYAGQSAATGRAEAEFVARHEGRVQRYHEARYSFAPEDGIYRVILMGTSQTYGVGATHFEDGMGRVVEREAQQRWPDGAVEVINMAVPGSKLARLVEQYETYWIRYDPDLLVINLGVNDLTNPLFEEELRRLIALNRERGIAVLLCTEAVSREARPEGHPHQAVVRKLAAELNIPLADVQAHLAQFDTVPRANVPDGESLWWDFVHGTSQGQQIIGEFIASEIHALAKLDGRIP